MRVLQASWSLWLLVAGLPGFAGAENLGHVVRDQSLGEGRGEVVASGIDPSVTAGGEADYLILPDLGSQRGGNLFHSFALFGVGPDEVALFSGHGAEALQNIVVRVTGGETSVIEGKLRSSVADADFYLLNPSGISIIGKGKIDANDLPGKFYSFEKASVFLSTADALAFGDAELESTDSFSATNLTERFSTSGCCEGPPTEFVFEGNLPGVATDPAMVEIDLLRGTGVDRGQTFAAVAGKVIVRANLTAYEGVVGLAAVGNAEVRVPVDLSRVASSDGAPWWSALGADARVDVSRTIRTHDNFAVGGTPAAGRILLRGGELVMSRARFEALGVESEGIDLASGGSILVEEDSLLHDNSLDSDSSGIRIEGGSLAVVGGARIESQAGRIFVQATGDVNLFGSALISTRPRGAPEAGNIEIRADSRILLQGGEGGLPEISARGDTSGGEGDGGDVMLHAPHVVILDGAAVTASTGGTGDAGDVTISGETLRISGQSSDGVQPSAVYSETIKVSDGGDGGSVVIEVQDLLTLEEGGEISVESQGSGIAGSVDVTVEGGSLQLRGGASIRAGSLVDVGETEVAGDINIRVAEDVVLVDSDFLTDSLDSGGKVGIDAGGNVELVRSNILTNVGGEGKGGDVAIGQDGGVPKIVLLDSSNIIATAVKGAGGNIKIAAAGFLASVDSVVDATSKLGIDGAVDVSAPVVQVEGRLDPLPASYLDVSALLRDHCAARRSAGASSFTLQGRPAIPPEPGDFLPSSLRSADDARVRGGAEMHPVSTFLPLRAQLSAFDPGCGGPGQTITAGG